MMMAAPCGVGGGGSPPVMGGFLVNPGAYEVSPPPPPRTRLQSYPPPLPAQPQSIMVGALGSSLQHAGAGAGEGAAGLGVTEDEYRCFSLPRFDKVPIPEPAPLSSLSAHDLMGLTTATSPSSAGELRQREHELTEQHRKVVQERLAEQEEERDARQRLEDIINMCASFVSGQAAASATSPVTTASTSYHRSSGGAALSQRDPADAISTAASALATTVGTSSAGGALASDGALTAIHSTSIGGDGLLLAPSPPPPPQPPPPQAQPGALSLSASSSLSTAMASPSSLLSLSMATSTTSTTAAAAVTAATVTASTTLGSSSTSGPCAAGPARRSPAFSSGIKTNGSLTSSAKVTASASASASHALVAGAAAAAATTGLASSAAAGTLASAVSPATPSSEDELAAINDMADRDSAATTMPTSPVSIVALSPPHSPRNRIRTVPGIPSPKDSLGAGSAAAAAGGSGTSSDSSALASSHFRPVSNAPTPAATSLAAFSNGGGSGTSSGGDRDERRVKPFVASAIVNGGGSGGSGGNGGSVERTAPPRSSSLQKMAAHIHAAQASLLASQLVQLEAAFKEQLDVLQMELALVTGELCDEQFSLKEDLIRYGKLEAEQEMLVAETLREKRDEERRLQLAGERILKWQELTVKMAETLEDPVSPVLEQEISERLENEVECLEAEKRAYEDLEFQIMESTARRDERLDEVNQRVLLMGNLIEQKEARIEELQMQQRAIAEEIELKKREWEEQRRKQQSSLRAVQQQQQQSSLDSESLSGSESDTGSEYQHSNCGSEMISSSTESEELFSPKAGLGGTAAAASENLNATLRKRDILATNSADNNNQLLLQQQQQQLDSKMSLQLRGNSTGATAAPRLLSQRPLTCYLPVFPDEPTATGLPFDLRAHIVGCGHTLELCAAELQVDSRSCRGYLLKLGSANRWWKKRWFVFDRGSRALMYFLDKSERKLKGVIHFESIDDVYVDHANKKMAAFCVKTLDRIYHLSSSSPEAMRVWIDVIFSGAHGYNRFLSSFGNDALALGD